MKQIYLIVVLIILLFPISMLGQRSFLDSGKIWKIAYTNWGIVQSTNMVSVNPNDTQSINGKMYINFQNKLIREENKKVFLRDSGIDYLIYDFNLNINDSFQGHDFYSKRKFTMYVLSRKKIKLKNYVDSVVYLEIHYPYARNYPPMKIIEGIGALNYHPITPYNLYYTSDMGVSVSCFLYKEEKVLDGLINESTCCYDDDILNSSNIWTIYESDDNGDTKYISKITSTNIDTTINNKSYRILKFNSDNIYVRKDSNKYYQYLAPWNLEFLLYKENAKVGDTIQNRNGFDPLIVDSIRIKLVNDNILKYYYTKNDIIIGGIGNVNEVFFLKSKNRTPEYRSGNVCFSRNTCNIFFNRYPESSNFKDCELELSILDNPSKFKIYPTYTNDYIHIERNDFTPIDIKIFDLLGNCILTKTSSIIKETVYLKNISPGIYFLNIGIYKTKIYKF